MMNEGRIPDLEDLLRVRGEVREAHRHCSERGFLADPRGFHPSPEAPPTMVLRRALHPAAPGRLFRLTFRSGFEPDSEPFSRRRWLSYRENRTAHAWLLRHRGDLPRPWVLCFHGLGTGSAWMDIPAFRARQLFDQGLNVLCPILPLHGARRPPGKDRAAMLSFDLVDTLHALAQAVWDSRRLIRWARGDGRATKIGLFGVSIGAYVASLVAAFEEAELVLAGIPLADIPALFDGHAPAEIRHLPPEQTVPGELLRDLFRLVSPLALAPRVPWHRRYLFAGVADRITPRAQTLALWEAWGRPSLQWFQGGHISFLWSGDVARYVDRVLAEGGLTTDNGGRRRSG